jgi:Ser-tRNA(Ala) deacylase AlaX
MDSIEEPEPGIDVGQTEIKKETVRAILVEIEGTEMWFPKSQIHDDSEIWQEGDVGHLYVTEWLAKKRGFA